MPLYSQKVTGKKESLVYISLKIKPTVMLQLMKNAIAPWLINFSWLNWRVLMWTGFSSKKTALIAIRRKANATINLLRARWAHYQASCACELTPLDIFLYGYVKSIVYADKSETTDTLEENVRLTIADIRPIRIAAEVVQNCVYQLEFIQASRDCHLSANIFKT